MVNAEWCFHNKLGLALATALLTVGLAGCSTGDSNQESTPVESVAAAPDTADLPLAQYIDVVRIYTTPENDDPFLKDEHEQHEANLAQCMKDRGFTYYPVPWVQPEVMPGFFPQGDRVWLPSLPDTREETARSGYGVLAAVYYPPHSEEIVKNVEYRDSLAPPAQAEYDLALVGGNPYGSAPQGAAKSCGELLEEEQVTADESNPSIKEMFKNQYQDLVMDLKDLPSDVMEDSRIMELSLLWSDCMSHRGYDFASGTAYSEFDVLINPDSAYMMAFRTRADGSLGESWFQYQGERSTPEEERSLTGSAAEIVIALDDFDCRAETSFTEIFTTVQIELENQFLETHYQQLQEMVAFAQQYPI